MRTAKYTSSYGALQAEKLSVVGLTSSDRILIHCKYVFHPNYTVYYQHSVILKLNWSTQPILQKSPTKCLMGNPPLRSSEQQPPRTISAKQLLQQAAHHAFLNEATLALENLKNQKWKHAVHLNGIRLTLIISTILLSTFANSVLQDAFHNQVL